ncbi:MAG: HlyD family efflux transporter periplasmic adaptor subunit, partial [Pseudomonadota bacterium]
MPAVTARRTSAGCCSRVDPVRSDCDGAGSAGGRLGRVKVADRDLQPGVRADHRNARAQRPGFSGGEVLVRFDCAILEAQRDAQAERQIAADLNAASLERLNRSGAAGRTETLLAQSEAKVAAAEFRAINAQLKGCVITAPFKGRMVETFVSTFENVGETQELIEIVDDQNLEIELIVPSNWLQWLSAGTGFDFRVFETGDVRPAEITRIGAIVDPVSRTAK